MFLCERCSDTRFLVDLWGPNYKRQVDKEIWMYEYEPVCSCCPLSPTNVIRIPRFVELNFHQTPNDVPYKKIHAKRAYEKELEFSGNVAEALILYSHFFQHQRTDYPYASAKQIRRILKQ